MLARRRDQGGKSVNQFERRQEQADTAAGSGLEARLGNEYPDWAYRHPEVPWRAMRGMRNRLAHGYFEITWT